MQIFLTRNNYHIRLQSLILLIVELDHKVILLNLTYYCFIFNATAETPLICHIMLIRVLLLQM